jgi:hypothetical protein
MAKLYDMAQMTVSGTPGTGTITLSAAAVVAGITYQTFAAAGALTGDSISYRISDSGNAWEIGRGTYNSTGPTLTRGLLFSSTGSLLSATAAALVSIAALGQDFTDLQASAAALYLPLVGGTLSGTLAVGSNANPSLALFSSGVFTAVYAPDGTTGNSGIFLGNSTDAVNFHRNTAHEFQDRTAANTFAILGPGLTVGAPTAQPSPAIGDINAQRIFVNGVAGVPDTTTGGITAGSGQGAVVLTSQFNVLATVASGMAVTLPVSVAGMRRIVRNSGANAVLVYPPSGGIINTMAANAAMTVQPNLTQYFEADGVQWYSVP